MVHDPGALAALLPMRHEAPGRSTDPHQTLTAWRGAMGPLVAVTAPVLAMLFWLDAFHRDRKAALSYVAFIALFAVVSVWQLSRGAAHKDDPEWLEKNAWQGD